MGNDEKKRVRESGSRRDRLGCLLVLVPLALLVTSPFTVWWLTEDSPWRVVVVDKTVPHPDYREHGALFWVLDHAKVPAPGGESSWVLDRDYVGYYPERKDDAGHAYGEALTEDHLRDANLLFLADGLGVFTGDYESEKDKAALDYSKKIFGGYDYEEALLVERFAKTHALIGEFNSFASPTVGVARHVLEDLFGVRWSEWTGRFFEDLSNREEVPRWARRHWKKHFGFEWDFTGPGYVFANEDSRIFVLQEDKDIGPRGFRIADIEADDPLMDGVLAGAPFRYWFDVVEPLPKSEVLASYHMHVTPSGRNIMNDFGVPTSFPAVVRASKAPLHLYFCGDFSDNVLDRGPHFLAGWPRFRRIGRFSERREDQSAFFWEFFVPFMTNVLRETSPTGPREDSR